VSPATSAARGKRGNAQYELVFIAMAPALGYNTYFIRPATNQQCTVSMVTHPTTDTVVSNNVSCTISMATIGHIIFVVLQVDSRWCQWSY